MYTTYNVTKLSLPYNYFRIIKPHFFLSLLLIPLHYFNNKCHSIFYQKFLFKIEMNQYKILSLFFIKDSSSIIIKIIINKSTIYPQIFPTKRF